MGEEKQINQELAEPISRLARVADPGPGDELALFRAPPNGASSFKLRYDRFVEQLVSDISARFGLSSMAFRDVSEYSRFDHQHDYTYAACYPAYDPSVLDSPVKLMAFDITDMNGTKHVDVYMPRLVPPPQPKPSIGDVRFLATSSIVASYGDADVEYVHVNPNGSTWIETRRVNNVNLATAAAIADGTFDGWVFLDGQSYFKAQGRYDFSEAYAKFGGRDGVFSVPLMNKFVKANPGTYCAGDALKAMPGQTGIVQHTHDIKDYTAAADSITAQATVQMEIADDYNNKVNHNTLHKGTGGDEHLATNLTADPIDLSLNFNAGDNKKFTYTADPADESWPKHYVMPVQVYIGGNYIGGGVEVTYGVQVTDIYGNVTNYEGINTLTRRSIGVAGSANTKIRKVVVGNDVTQIEPRMFADFTELVEVDLHSCSKDVEVPEGCCTGCGKLSAFVFPAA